MHPCDQEDTYRGDGFVSSVQQITCSTSLDRKPERQTLRDEWKHLASSRRSTRRPRSRMSAAQTTISAGTITHSFGRCPCQSTRATAISGARAAMAAKPQIHRPVRRPRFTTIVASSCTIGSKVSVVISSKRQRSATKAFAIEPPDTEAIWVVRRLIWRSTRASSAPSPKRVALCPPPERATSTKWSFSIASSDCYSEALFVPSLDRNYICCHSGAGRDFSPQTR